MPHVFLTVQQVADALQVCVKTVQRHARELGGRRIGGQWRFHPDVLAQVPTSPITTTTDQAHLRLVRML